jgi:hypothetical protein
VDTHAIYGRRTRRKKRMDGRGELQETMKEWQNKQGRVAQNEGNQKGGGGHDGDREEEEEDLYIQFDRS